MLSYARVNSVGLPKAFAQHSCQLYQMAQSGLQCGWSCWFAQNKFAFE